MKSDHKPEKELILSASTRPRKRNPIHPPPNIATNQALPKTKNHPYATN